MQREHHKRCYSSGNTSLNNRRMRFLNKFYLFTGVSRSNNMVADSLHNPDMFFNCGGNQWPLCLYDFTYKNRMPSYFVYRCGKDTIQLIDDYFYGSGTAFECDTDDGAETSAIDKLLIERNTHLCQHSNFTEKFIKLYVSGCDQLLNSELLTLQITSQGEIFRKLDEFMRFILFVKDEFNYANYSEQSLYFDDEEA